MQHNDLTFSRRGLLLTVAGGAALPLLAACGAVAPAAPAAPPSGSASSATTSAKPASALPNFIANTTGPKPDFPAAGPQYEDGFINYPTNPTKALPTTPPGGGGKVQCYTNNSAPAPPTPFDQNQAWQETNKQLNADVQFTIIPQSDYLTKLATVMAGNESAGRHAHPRRHAQRRLPGAEPHAVPPGQGGGPDAIPRRRRGQGLSQPGGHSHLRVGQFRVCAEWQALHAADRALLPGQHAAQELRPSTMPPSARTTSRKTPTTSNAPCSSSTAPTTTSGLSALYQNQMYYIYYFAAMFGAPNNWALDANGKLTRDIETPAVQRSPGRTSATWLPPASTIRTR